MSDGTHGVMEPGKVANEVEHVKELFLPSKTKMIQSLRELGLSETKIQHVQEVADLALRIADEIERGTQTKADRRIVEAGAIFHDTGLAKSYKVLELEPEAYPEHCVIGADMIRRLGLPERVARCAEVHEFAGGITRKEAEELRFPILPYRDSYAPETVEEQIVTVADAFMFVKEVKERGWEGFDLWKNSEQVKDLYFGYVNDCYERKLHRRLEKTHPMFERLHRLTEPLFRFVRRDFISGQ